MTHCHPHRCCWNTHTTGVCVFVSECALNDRVYAPDESLSSTLIGCHLYCEDEYMLRGWPWGEIPWSGATLELTHFLSLCLSLRRDVLHKRPAAHTGHFLLQTVHRVLMLLLAIHVLSLLCLVPICPNILIASSKPLTPHGSVLS